MYSFVLLKIHGQDRAVYFSRIPLEEWPRVVDARPSSPQHLTSLDADEEGLKHCGAADEDEQSTYVREKLRGKQPNEQEPSSKRRKTARSS